MLQLISERDLGRRRLQHDPLCETKKVKFRKEIVQPVEVRRCVKMRHVICIVSETFPHILQCFLPRDNGFV